MNAQVYREFIGKSHTSVSYHIDECVCINFINEKKNRHVYEVCVYVRLHGFRFSSGPILLGTVNNPFQWHFNITQICIQFQKFVYDSMKLDAIVDEMRFFGTSQMQFCKFSCYRHASNESVSMEMTVSFLSLRGTTICQ